MKTLNQVRDEWIDSRFDNPHNKLIAERSWDACLEHLSKGADCREFYICDATDNSGYHVIDKPKDEHLAVNVFRTIEHQALLAKCAQLAKTQDMVRMAIEGVYQTMVNNNLIGEEFAKKHIDYLMCAILEIGAGK